MDRSAICARRLCMLVLLCLVQPAVADTERVYDAGLEEQRSLFRVAYRAAELGDWGPAERAEGELSAYPLWPDLRAAWLLSRVRNLQREAVEEFLTEFGELPPAVRLRSRWIRELARREDWHAYLDAYDTHYADVGNHALDCLATYARQEIDEDYQPSATLIDRLWLVGRSQPEECDPVFARLRAVGLLTAEHYRQRFRLAVETREFRLAKYLARELDEEAKTEASAWLSMQHDPAGTLARATGPTDDRAKLDRISYGIRLLAHRDPAYAAELWHRLAERLQLPKEERWTVAGYIGIRAAAAKHPASTGLLRAVPLALAETDALAWRIRDSLLSGDWNDVRITLERLPADERRREIWRYWRARAVAETGSYEEAKRLYGELAGERSYYGFMAADALDLPYALGHVPMQPDEELIDRLAEEPSIRRAGELFHVGLESLGRSEWNHATAGMEEPVASQAAILAHRWGWHSRAIALAARIGRYDDLDLRYPIPWSDAFATLSAAVNLRKAWALGIARSESLFMPDIRSRAGAVGIMQLMPSTGREIARRARLPYRGYSTLMDPVTNIELGTRYLATVYERFAFNPVLATAAYNAGPHRVEKWLPEAEPLDAAIWIETLPFGETREYVKRVLTADSIFSWRLTGRQHRLSALQPPVLPVADRVAQVRR